MVTFAAVLHSETPAGGGRGGQLASTKKQGVGTKAPSLHAVSHTRAHMQEKQTP
eukprot:CAMPEP_0173115192 /NCGR_PEP_ID=MMETSP1102-20130122/48228_1 /TAXON_ID=49646 /ORGANISM="Geminigera sp., Strain Caron Lab Isolate" /LENGTH=53 /DNA_ID=CAMNT_0014017929 /DNA_START=8 /DNA_END=169 /DNA_ORIENTATION=-